MNHKIISGKYEIKREIGRGGMGIIYEALHTALNRSVAIKVLHSQFTGDPTFLKRFQREARAMARLDHENIIRVFDVAEDAGLYYIVMEYFPGKDLKQIIIEKGSLSKTESLSIALQVAKALSYAHACGIIHRDIKPSNIMVNEGDIVKIADFGIAAATDEVSVTATGNIIGTPEYMSAEQARGEQLDGRNDLYSLGMVLYEMLSGHTSYAGISGRAVLGKLLYDSEEFDLSFQSDIPLSLRDLVRKLLIKNRENRVPDAANLIENINKVLSELDDEPGPSETLEKANLAETMMFNVDESSDTAILQESSSGVKEVEHVSYRASSVQETLEEPSSPIFPEKLQSSKIKEGPLSGMTATNKTIRTISVVSLVAIIFIAIIYMLPPIEDKELPSPPSPPLPTVSPLVDDIREIQSAIRKTQTELEISLREADTPNILRWAKDRYDEALDLKNKGSKILRDGNDLFDEGEYGLAKEKFILANSILTQSHEGFLTTKQTAEVRIVQAEKSRMEEEKRKQQQAKLELERLRQERIVSERERLKQEEVTRIEKEKLLQEETRAKNERLAQESAKAERERLTQARILAERERLKQEAVARIEKEKLLQEEAKTKKERFAQERAKAERERLREERIIAKRERLKEEADARIEKERLAQERAKAEKERLAQERIMAEREKQKQEAIARGKREKLKQEKARIEREKLVAKRNTPAPADIDLIGGILKRLKTAYEKKDLRSLQRMSNMSIERSRFLERIFQNYNTIRISITDLSLTGDAAQAIISITGLTSQDGSRVLPSSRWKEAKLTIRKDEGRWGKVIW